LNKLKLRNFLIYLPGIFIINCLNLYSNFAIAESLNKKYNTEFDLKKNTLKHNSNNSKIEDKFLSDLKKNGGTLFNLLALDDNDTAEKQENADLTDSLNKSNIQEKFLVEIEADNKYRKNNIFYAEGNPIIYFSNATLGGNLVTYDIENRVLTVIGNVTFKRGSQFFNSEKLFYDLKNDKGYIDDIYGVLDSKTFEEDFKIELDDKNRKFINENDNFDITELKKVSSANIGFVNDFEDNKSLNITKLNLSIPGITRWRYKADKLFFDSESFSSDKIFFTNDVYNYPQILFKSYGFTAEIVEDKLRLISRNTWIDLDNKFKFPIGRTSIFDRDPITQWGLGADFAEKDGYYVFRGSKSRNLFGNFSFKLQPYYLVQRAIKGKTKSYTAKNTSVFSGKVESDATTMDYFALDVNTKGKINEWDVNSLLSLNSLNLDRLDESFRSKFTLKKRIDLNQDKESNEVGQNLIPLEIGLLNEGNNSISRFDEEIYFNSENNSSENQNQYDFNNFLDLQFYNVFREKVKKDFATEEIYFASGFNISNKKSWLINKKKTNLSLIYDFGHFKSKSRTKNEFKELFRNSFVAQYNHKLPLWESSPLDKTIDKTYKFSPTVIRKAVDWETGLQTGLFFYSDDSSQIASKFTTGPSITLGNLKNNLLDYTYVKANFNYVLKEGDSPFSFDNISKNPNVKISLEQQIFGPLIFSYETTLNLDNGKYSNPNYGLNINRRAYSIGAFYNSSEESLGIKFNIFNFDYSGLSSKF
jgi:hypothetical protein